MSALMDVLPHLLKELHSRCHWHEFPCFSIFLEIEKILFLFSNFKNRNIFCIDGDGDTGSGGGGDVNGRISSGMVEAATMSVVVVGAPKICGWQ